MVANLATDIAMILAWVHPADMVPKLEIFSYQAQRALKQYWLLFTTMILTLAV